MKLSMESCVLRDRFGDEAAMRMIAGTARSMGVEVVD